MPSNTLLQSHLSRLRLLVGSSSVFRSVENGNATSKTISEFKQLVVAAIERNAISDETIIEAADCLYALKACDPKTNAQICKAVEVRPSIYTRPLHGGVLWSFHTSAGLNTKRKKVVKSSCCATLCAFMDELFALRTDDKLAVKLDSTLCKLTIVGQCFKLPISTRTRLEQAIVDARDALSSALHASPTTVTYLGALKSLQVRCETVAKDAVASFLTAAANYEVLSVNTITKAIKILCTWKIGPVGAEYSAIEVLNEELLSPPQLLLKSTSALVKLYVAASRVTPQRGGTTPPCATDTISDDDDRKLSADNVVSDGCAPSNNLRGIHQLSMVLLKYCVNIIDRCNSHNLLLLYNSMAHHILRDEKHCQYASGDPWSPFVHRVSMEVHDALQVDCSAGGKEDVLPLRLYDRQDLLTILRSALVMKRVCGDGPAEVENIAKHILAMRYGVIQDCINNSEDVEQIDEQTADEEVLK